MDAIRVTFNLGIRYLWIDALCILQNSDIDKSLEIAKMPFIYSRAILTVVASRARSVSEGFLQDRSEGEISGANLVFQDEQGSYGVLLLPHEAVDHFTSVTSQAENSWEPLGSRAWAFQERLLSPRLLDFTTYQTIWMCQYVEKNALKRQMWTDGLEMPTRASFNESIHRLSATLAPWKDDEDRFELNLERLTLETYRQSVTFSRSKALVERIFKPATPHLHSNQSEYSNIAIEPSDDLHPTDHHSMSSQGSEMPRIVERVGDLDTPDAQWAWLVKSYTQRQLTFPTDRLPAMSSAVNVFQNRHKEGVIAGIRIDMLPLGLLWSRSFTGRRLSPRPDRYCGPTWSWASVIGPITTHYGYFHMGSEHESYGGVLSWDLEYLHPEAGDGALRLAVLKYHGRLKSAYWRWPHKDELDYRTKSTSKLLRHLEASSQDGEDSEASWDSLDSEKTPITKTTAQDESSNVGEETLVDVAGDNRPSPYLFTKARTGREELFIGSTRFDLVLSDLNSILGTDAKLELLLLPISTGRVWSKEKRKKMSADSYILEHNNEPENLPPLSTRGLILYKLQSGEYARLGVFDHDSNFARSPRLVGTSDGDLLECYTEQHEWLREGELQGITLV
jgi:hypothetical protein